MWSNQTELYQPELILDLEKGLHLKTFRIQERRWVFEFAFPVQLTRVFSQTPWHYSVLGEAQYTATTGFQLSLSSDQTQVPSFCCVSVSSFVKWGVG